MKQVTCVLGSIMQTHEWHRNRWTRAGGHVESSADVLWDDIQAQNEVENATTPRDTVEVLAGPACWTDYPLSTSTALTKPRRFWQVRSEQTGLVGWIREYERSIMGTTLSHCATGC